MLVDEAVIYEKLNHIFRDIFDDESIVLSPTTTAADIPGWDSVNHVNISVASEMAFGIRFNSSELEELHNVGDLVKTIARKVG
jgi:acyl carrier protein